MSEISPLLEVRDLVVERNGISSLDIPSFKIYPGRTLAVIGPNGSGKTTLLRSLTHLVPHARGEIIFKGEKIIPDGRVHLFRRKIAFVFQDPVLFDMTVYSNVASGLRIRGRGKKEIKETVERQLSRFGISHLRSRKALTLSGGEAQRTSLARAFALEPEILFLDEPFTSLDVKARESLMDDLEKALVETGMTAVFTTHDRMEALRLADRMAILSEGHLVQEGSPQDIMMNPANEFVAAYAGVEIILNGEVVTADEGSFMLRVSDRNIEVAGNASTGERMMIGLRPENIMLSTEITGQVSTRNSFRGKVTRVIPMGYHFRVYVDCGFSLVSHVTSHSLDSLGLYEGKDITVYFKATSVHIIRRDA